jgi:hypothetical protein
MATSDVLSGQATPFDARHWAAEELALQLGWLSECPYHGEPFKTASGAHDGCAADVPVDTDGELYVLAASVSAEYAEHCPFCERERALPE